MIWQIARVGDPIDIIEGLHIQQELLLQIDIGSQHSSKQKFLYQHLLCMKKMFLKTRN